MGYYEVRKYPWAEAITFGPLAIGLGPSRPLPRNVIWGRGAEGGGHLPILNLKNSDFFVF